MSTDAQEPWEAWQPPEDGDLPRLAEELARQAALLAHDLAKLASHASRLAAMASHIEQRLLPPTGGGEA